MQPGGVNGQFQRGAGADRGAGGDPGGPQRLAADQRGDGLVFLIVAAGRAAIEWCSTGGASMVKIAWISVPRPSVTPAVTAIFGQPASANAASSKSEGRMPRMTCLPKNPSSPGLPEMTVAGTGSLNPAKATAGLSSRTRSRG